jgi:hypothetical protein
MSRINRVPFGLQDLLGSVNLGVNPSDMAEQVRGEIDLFPHWASERLTIIDQTGVQYAGTGIVAALTFTIPNGQAWIPVTTFSSINFEIVGQQAAWAFQVNRVPNLGNPLLSGAVSYEAKDPVTSIQIGQITRLIHNWPRRVLFGAGTTFAVRLDMVNQNGGADPTIIHRMLYYRLNT